MRKLRRHDGTHRVQQAQKTHRRLRRQHADAKQKLVQLGRQLVLSLSFPGASKLRSGENGEKRLLTRNENARENQSRRVTVAKHFPAESYAKIMRAFGRQNLHLPYLQEYKSHHEIELASMHQQLVYHHGLLFQNVDAHGQ